MTDEVVKTLDLEDVSPLGGKILSLFAWLNDIMNNDNDSAMKRLPIIFDKSQEELDVELEKLIDLNLLSLNKSN